VGFWDFFWLMIWGFVFISYLMVLFQVIVDVFRDPGLTGGIKVVWLLCLLIAPPLTALIYVIARGRGMNERAAQAQRSARQVTDDYIRSVSAVDPASQIANAKGLLDSGAITAEEYGQLKAKALA